MPRTAPKRRRRPFRLVVEAMESRQLMTGYATVTPGSDAYASATGPGTPGTIDVYVTSPVPPQSAGPLFGGTAIEGVDYTKTSTTSGGTTTWTFTPIAGRSHDVTVTVDYPYSDSATPPSPYHDPSATIVIHASGSRPDSNPNANTPATGPLAQPAPFCPAGPVAGTSSPGSGDGTPKQTSPRTGVSYGGPYARSFSTPGQNSIRAGTGTALSSGGGMTADVVGGYVPPPPTPGPQPGGGAISAVSPTWLYSSGYGGAPIDVSLSWSNLAGYAGGAAGSAFGTGMASSSLPYLTQSADGGIAAVQSAGNAIFFTDNGAGASPRYTAQFYSTDTLTPEGTDGDFKLTQSDGTVLHYWGFETSYVFGGTTYPLPLAQRGQLKYYSDADAPAGAATFDARGNATDTSGHLTTTVYDPTTGYLTSIRRSDGSSVESYDYTYLTAGPNIGFVSNVALSRGASVATLQIVQQVAFTYYEGTQSYGNRGDLRSMTLETGDATPSAIDTVYYRWYTPADSGPTGYVHALKYQFNPESYALMVASLPAGTTPDTASDTLVAPYADQYYEYNAQHQVTRTILQGTGCSCSGSSSTGQGAYTYTYAANASPGTGTNAWVTKATETRYDSNGNALDQTIVYTNAAGQVMLNAFDDTTDGDVSSTLKGVSTLSGDVWATYYRYDDAGRLILTAQPSAVTITSLATLAAAQANADLVGFNAAANTYQYLSASSGLISKVDYGQTTGANPTTVNGVTGTDVAGYFKDDTVQQGYAGTPTLMDAQQYLAHSASGASVYLTAIYTTYAGPGGSGARATTSAYTWFGSSDRVQSVLVTRPNISAAQDGPNSADVDTTYFDAFGRAIWFKDGDGYIDYSAYDDATGSALQSITNVQAGLAPSPPWTLPSGGQALVTTYQVDGLGRTVMVNSPNGNGTWVVYDDVDHETRTYRGWSVTTVGGVTTASTVGPIEVTREDRLGNYVETFTMAVTPLWKNVAPAGQPAVYAPSGAEAIGNLQTLSRSFRDRSGRVIEEDDYASLAGVTYSPSVLKYGTASFGVVGSGSSLVYAPNASYTYAATLYNYDDRGRLSRIVDPVGTITRTSYDALDRVVATQIGTADPYVGGGSSNTSNMVQVSSDQYDNGLVGDGNLTLSAQYPNMAQFATAPAGVVAAARVTAYVYDGRDRLVGYKQGVAINQSWQIIADPADGTHRPIIWYTLDNLGEVTATAQYDGDGVSLATFAPSPTVTASNLRAYYTASYDDQGRVFKASQYNVSQTAGAKVSDLLLTTPLTTSTYYDHRGDVIAVSAPGGLWTKSLYDGTGRLVDQAQSDGATGTSWANASAVTSDHVLEETAYTYDGDGNVILAVTKQRFDSDPLTGSTGVGYLGAPGSTLMPPARDYYAASYYDAADRLVASVDVGTDGGSVYTRPAGVSSNPAAALVTSYTYNAAGWVDTVTDPRGIVTKTNYDALGRAVKVIAAYNSSNSTQTNSANVATDYTYDGLGHTTTVTAEQYPEGSPPVQTKPNQTTTYVYGITTAQGSLVNSNDVLQALVQPDKSTGAYPLPANFAAQRELYAYNALGDMIAKNDGNGTIHYAYAYDTLGRLTDDTIQALGGGVDGGVVDHRTAYDGAGHAYLFTGYNGSGGYVNQVKDTFNGLGQLISEAQAQQAHAGANDGNVTGTSPTVYYAYDEMAGGVNDSRMWGMAYPSGRAVDYVYSTTLDAAISRVTGMYDVNPNGTLGTELEGYTYLGLGTVVAWSHPQAGVTLTYIRQPNVTTDGVSSTGGDQYVGLDQFGRVADENWVTGAGTTSWAPVDRCQYGYDRDGDVLYKLNLVDPTQSELYHTNSAGTGDGNTAYDALDRLVAFSRGRLTASGNNHIDGDPSKLLFDTITAANTSASETWSLDALGNQLSTTSTTWAAGVPTVVTTVRAYNADNQITATTVTTKIGTGTPTSTSPTTTYDNDGNTIADGTQTYVYDAWNRLLAVKSGSTYQAIYQYDALGRRVREDYGASGANTLLYSPDWQVLEERFTPAGGAAAVKYQYVWGLTYIDDLVLRDTYASGSLTQRLYATHDANYDVTALTNTAGTVQERYLYDPYGAVTYTNASYGAISASAFGWQYLHQGGRLDGKSGWYDFRNRDEVAGQGRWAERDPLGLDGGDRNLYGYVGTNPINGLDPSGLYYKDAKYVGPVFYGDRPYYKYWDRNLHDKVSDSLERIKALLPGLINQIDAELKSLSPCLLKALGPDLQALQGTLRKMLNGINSPTEPLEFYHYDISGSTALARTKRDVLGLGFYTPSISFNDGGVNNWQGYNAQMMDGLLGHELSHVYNTYDYPDFTDNALTSAQNIGILTGGGSFYSPQFGAYNNYYYQRKRDAEKECSKQSSCDRSK